MNAKVHQIVSEFLRRMPHGARGALLRKAGASKNFLSKLSRRLEEGLPSGYDLARIVALLEASGEDVADFFADALGHDSDPVARLRRETLRLRTPAPAALAPAVQALRAAAGEEVAIPDQSETLSKLDADRYVDPCRALADAERMVDLVASGYGAESEAVALLGVWGSCLRQVDEIDEAQQVIVAALELAEERRCHPLVGDLLQRASYAVGIPGRYAAALALTDAAIVRHELGGHAVGVGKALVDRGQWLHYLGRFEEAVASNERALAVLPETQPRNRFAALQVLGNTYKDLGDLEAAKEAARRARSTASQVGPLLVGKCTWLEAQIALVRGSPGDADRLLQEAVTTFLEDSPVNAAMASIDRMRIALGQGRGREAYALARSMSSLIGHLRAYPAAEATVVELANLGFAGRGLTAALLARFAERIRKGGRPRRCPRKRS